MDSWELAEQIVDFIKMANGALTDEKLTEEINAMIIKHLANY